MITPDNPNLPQLKLSPCPFCGQSAPVVWLYRERQWRANGPKWVAHCKSCNVTKEGNTQLQAVAAWNTRSAAVEPPSTSFECMIYDVHLPSMTARFRIPEGLPFASGMYEIHRVRRPTAEDVARWAHLPEPPDDAEQGDAA